MTATSVDWRRVGVAQVAARGGGLLLQLVHTLLAARALGTATFGELAAALAVLTVAGALAEFGLSTSTVLAMVRGEPDELPTIARASFDASLATAATGALLAAAFAVVVLPAEARSMMWLLLPWYLLARLDLPFIAALQATHRVRRTAFGELSSRAVLAASAVAANLLPSDRMSLRVVTVCVGFALSELVGLAVVAQAVALARSNVARSLDLVRSAAPVAFVSAGALLHSRIDQLVLGASGREAELGIYALLYRFVDAAMALVGAGAAMVLPMMVGSAGVGRRSDLARASAVVGPVAAVSFTILAPVALRVVGDANQVDGTLVLLLAVVMAVSIANIVPAQVLLIESKMLPLVVITSIGVVANLVLCVCLVPILGSRGAASATLMTELGGFLSLNWVAGRRPETRLPLWLVLVPVVAGASSAVTAQLLHGLG